MELELAVAQTLISGKLFNTGFELGADRDRLGEGRTNPPKDDLPQPPRKLTIL